MKQNKEKGKISKLKKKLKELLMHGKKSLPKFSFIFFTFHIYGRFIGV